MNVEQRLGAGIPHRPNPNAPWAVLARLEPRVSRSHDAMRHLGRDGRREGESVREDSRVSGSEFSIRIFLDDDPGIMFESEERFSRIFSAEDFQSFKTSIACVPAA